MQIEGNNAAFDPEEQAILAQLRPEVDPATEAAGLPADTNAVANPPAAPAPPAEAPAATPVPTPAPTAAPGAPAPSPEPTPAPTQPPAPQGDPKAALRASRQAEKRLRAQLEEKDRELEALRTGKGPVDTQVTDEELAELEENFPVQAKAIREVRALKEKIEAIAPRPQADDGFVPVSYEPEVQEIIDSVPQLQAWQYDPAGQDKFQRAIAYDTALKLDPDWKDRTVTERFAEAARRTVAATASPAPSAAPAAARTDPALAVANAPVEGPKGISDFRGGGPANAPAANYTGMSDEQIMASLPVE